MNREEVIRMAREAWKGRGAVDAWFDECAPNFERFASLVAAADRDRILTEAKSVQTMIDGTVFPEAIIEAIRALT